MWWGRRRGEPPTPRRGAARGESAGRLETAATGGRRRAWMGEGPWRGEGGGTAEASQRRRYAGGERGLATGTVTPLVEKRAGTPTLL